jgi:putative acetyltransferase
MTKWNEPIPNDRLVVTDVPERGVTWPGGVHPVGPEEGARLLEVWESAVRATHHFLTEADIQSLKPLVRPGLFALEHLLCVRDPEGRLVAFLGVDKGKMEALFVHPSWHGLGVGRRLARHAVVVLGATAVDVNEQNEGAIAFYRRLGYEVEGRSEVDSAGRPFPLLHMRKRNAGW